MPRSLIGVTSRRAARSRRHEPAPKLRNTEEEKAATKDGRMPDS
jgi:hypothetical protein